MSIAIPIVTYAAQLLRLLRLLCNRMVNPPPQAGFLPGHLLQATPSRFRAGGLRGLCGSRTALAHRFDLCARIALTICVRGQIDNAKSHA
jgi:hypothetical protein